MTIRKTQIMKYGQFSANRSINEAIYQCFDYIHEEDIQKFLKKFCEQPHDKPQIMHTFRELILGAYLVSSGLNVNYDYLSEASTPDWCIFDETSKKLMGIVELTNFHAKREIESEIAQANRRAVWMPPNDDRLYDRIWKKARAYKGLVEKNQIPYVIAVHGGFFAAVDSNELNRCLYNDATGLFRLYPTISGLLFFEDFLDIVGRWRFTYFSNSHASISIELPNGAFL